MYDLGFSQDCVGMNFLKRENTVKSESLTYINKPAHCVNLAFRNLDKLLHENTSSGP